MTSAFLDERLREHADRDPRAPAVGVPDGWVTYGELAAAVDRLAERLRTRGVGRGTTVINALAAGPRSVTAGLAIQRAGGCLVEVNPASGSAMLSHIVQLTSPRHAFVENRDARALQSAGVSPDDMWIAGSEGARSRIPDIAEPLALRPGDQEQTGRASAAVRTADDDALILFTSGSTAEPRGVRLTYRNIAANTSAIVAYLGLTREDRVLSILPLSYSYGRSLLQTHLWVGGSIFFDRRFMYPHVVLDAINSERCTGFAGVPLTFEVLRRRCDPARAPMPALRYVTQAGGAMSIELREWVRRAFAPAHFYVMYGQTEATARLTYLPPDKLTEKPDSVGIPIPGVDLRIVDDDGRDVAAQAVGNLIARGDNVFAGYLQAPDETRDALRDGWLWTGDLARRDESGFFYIVGRKSAMLKVSGHRFSATEIETRLARHAAVKEACVVGVPDALTGESAWAFVVLAEPATPPDLRRFCAEALPSFKVPKAVVPLDSLPRCAAGKVRRGALVEHAHLLARKLRETSSV